MIRIVKYFYGTETSSILISFTRILRSNPQDIFNIAPFFSENKKTGSQLSKEEQLENIKKKRIYRSKI